MKDHPSDKMVEDPSIQIRHQNHSTSMLKILSTLSSNCSACTSSNTSNDPILLISRSLGLVPLTDSVTRKFWTRLSFILHISPRLTFHDFRRSGTTWAFQHGVPLYQIMHHGTWKSNAIWSYIQNVPTVSSPVSQTFQQHLLL